MCLKDEYEKNENFISKELFIVIKIIFIFIFINIKFFIIPKSIKETSTNIIPINITYNTFITINTTVNESPKKNKTQINISKNNERFIKNYLDLIPSKFEEEKNYEREHLKLYFSLKNLSKNNSLNLEYKKEILEIINDKYKRNLSNINELFIEQPIAFGNTLVCLNNVIFYCEILGCKNIYLNKNYNWHITKKVISKETNIEISLKDKTSIDCNNSTTLCITFEYGFCLNPLIVKQKIRIGVLKEEIKRNLPKVNINPNDLYIHIRSGNIFVDDFNPSYSQPPLCFYKKILNEFKFRNIYIISGDNNNPVIGKLLKKFPKIIFNLNSLEDDFSYLSNAYNLVSSVSTFLQTAIKLNDNLKNLWEYDIYRKSEKYVHLHPDIYKFPKNYTLYRMKPSEIYKKEMFAWKNEQNQLNLMIKEKCQNNFIIYRKL